MRSLIICTAHLILLGEEYRGKMGWAWSAYGGEKKRIYRVLVGKPEGKGRLGEPGIDGKIILRCIYRKYDMRVWSGSRWLKMRQFAGTCECGNETSGSIKCGEFFD
jgi:hypothetical protein